MKMMRWMRRACVAVTVVAFLAGTAAAPAMAEHREDDFVEQGSVALQLFGSVGAENVCRYREQLQAPEGVDPLQGLLHYTIELPSGSGGYDFTLDDIIPRARNIVVVFYRQDTCEETGGFGDRHSPGEVRGRVPGSSTHAVVYRYIPPFVGLPGLPIDFTFTVYDVH